MIIILDDTFNERHKYNDVSFLKIEKYKAACKIYEKPMMKDFKDFIAGVYEIDLLCNHKSLKLFNNNYQVIDGKEAIENLFLQLKDKSISRIEFSLDMQQNIMAKTLKKDVFYSNLKPFLENYIENRHIELKILFYGENYNDIERLSLIDRMMDEINVSEYNEFINNASILDGLKILFLDKKPEDIISDWSKNELSKKEIITLINSKIK